MCKLISPYCNGGFLDKRAIDPMEGPYSEIQGELTMVEGLVMHGSRMVVPQALQMETLKKLHEGNLGSHDAVSEPERRCGGPVSHNRSLTSS